MVFPLNAETCGKSATVTVAVFKVVSRFEQASDAIPVTVIVELPAVVKPVAVKLPVPAVVIVIAAVKPVAAGALRL